VADETIAITQSATAAATQAGTQPSVSGTAAVSTGLGRTETGGSSPSLGSLIDPLLAALDRRLGAFEQSLSSFVWPAKSDAWFNSRLVIQDKELSGKLAAAAPRLDTVANPNKFYSKGLDVSQPSGLAAGDYAFTLAMGTAQETVKVGVGKGDTWGTVLESVRKAVNSGPLAAQADVVYQNTPYSLLPDTAATGRVLAISVNPAMTDQSITLADTQGHLLASLGVAATANPTSPATPTSYLVQGNQQAVASRTNSAPMDANAPTSLALGRHNFAVTVATNGVSGSQPTTYVSSAFDPTAATTLAPGDYSFSYRFGQESKSVTVSVAAGSTWNDVLQNMAAGINGQAAFTSTSTSMPVGSSSYSQPGLVARVESSPIPSAATQGVFTDGVVLTVSTEEPFAGQSLDLFDGSGSLLSSVGLTSKLTGQPLSVTVQKSFSTRDVMNAVADTLSSSNYQVSALTSDLGVNSGAVPGKTIVNSGGVGLSAVLSDLRIGRRMNLTDGPTGLLASLNMLSGIPGQDGEMVVNGVAQVSENNRFATDQGRVQMNLTSSFSETLPLTVVESMDAIANSFGDVVTNYNDLQSFLRANKSAFTASLSRALDTPAARQIGNLAKMGVSRSGKSGQLWVQSKPFWQALVNNPGQAKQTLWSPPNGLVPAWRQTVANIRQTGLGSYLAPNSALAGPPDTVKTEFDLEKKHRLVNLLG
jgi:flagellar capping protein FliD